VALAFLFSLSAPSVVFGQEITAAISGLVTDATGSAVPDAAISAVDQDRGTSWKTITDKDGRYDLPRLPVGTYKVAVEQRGFQRTEQGGVHVVLNQTAHLDFSLTVGSITESVQVTADVAIVQTDTTQLSTVIDSRTNAQLPLASRNYVQLTLLTAGAVTPNPAGFKGPQTTYISDRPYINGNREQANNFVMDGMDNNQVSDNTVAYAPSVDAIEEFNEITQNAPAEFGNFMGGITSVSIKAGSNRFHGAVFEFFRNDKLNANEWQNNVTGAPRPVIRWNEFGASLGGPVKHNKLFFFIDYQGSRFDQPAITSAVTLLTAAERQGDFSSLLARGSKSTQIYSPFDVSSTGQRTPFAGNILPKSLLSHAAFNIANSPLNPAPINTSLTNNQFNTTRTYTNSDQGDARMDWHPDDKDHVFGRYSQSNVDSPLTYSIPLIYSTFGHYPIHNGVLDYTRTFGPTLVNDLRAGVNYNIANLGPDTTNLPNVPEEVGIPGVQSPILPDMTFSGGFAGDLGSTGNIKLFADTVIQYGDTLILNHNRHTFRFGFQGMRIRLNNFYAGGNGLAGNFIFNGQFTTSSSAVKFGSGSGQPEADFMLGLPSSVAVGVTPTTFGQRGNIFGAFVQDDWRVDRSLTINLGLRWELHTPWVEVFNRQTNFNLATGAIELAGQTNDYNDNRALYNQYNGIYNWQPRVGLAWAPGSGRLVFRSAFTLSSFLEGTGNNLRLFINPPLLSQKTVSYASLAFPASTLDQGYVPIGSTTNPYVASQLRVWDPNVRPAVSLQWNLSVQRQFGSSMSLQAAYVGQKNDHLMSGAAYYQKVLQPDGTVAPSRYLAGNSGLVAEIGNISGTASAGNQSYHALQVTLQRRLAEGLEFQVAYTWSKCMTDSTGFYGEGAQASNQSTYAQNFYNRAAEWGECYYDLTHSLIIHETYDLPFGRNKLFLKNAGKVVNALIGDWQVNGILSFHNGFPLTISGSDNSGTNARSARANCLGPANVFGEQNSPLGGFQWFDPSVYAPAAKGTFGSCGVSTVRGPGLATVDLGMSKRFAVHESQNVELRAELINTTNSLILNAPKTALGSTLGLLQSSQGARNIQLGLKYNF
jgi:hypothetical protein